jgi:DNA-binding NarL/FixJ family response regulator
LLTAAEGDVDEGTILAEAAHAMNVAHGDRWEQARTQVIAGDIHRRARRRAKARSAFSDAATIFGSLGAGMWVMHAREQLERIGAGRDEARGGLTPTQEEVAQLVISGSTNREVADRLFMSVHTVEAHLSAIYRALGIRPRNDLGRALGSAAPPLRDSSAEIRDSAPATDPEA